MRTEIEKSEKESLERFNFMKDARDKIVSTLEKIKVTDDTSEAIATQQLSVAKNFTVEIETLRKMIKDPYLQTGKRIDEAAKSLLGTVPEKMDVLGKELLAWKQVKVAIVKKELEAAQAIQNEIIQYQGKAILAINKAHTKSDLSKVFLEFIGKDNTSFPSDEHWGKFVSDAKEMLAVIKRHGKLRLDQINELANAPVEQKETLIAKQEVQTAEIVVETAKAEISATENAIAIAQATKTTGVRKDWKFTVINQLEVWAKFLIVDEAKVREWMREQVKEGKFEPGKSYIVCGIKYEQVDSLTIRK